MTEATDYKGGQAVASVKDLFDELKAAEAKVKSIKTQIALVRVALRGPSRKPKAPKTAGQVLSARSPSKRKGLPKSKLLASATVGEAAEG